VASLAFDFKQVAAKNKGNCDSPRVRLYCIGLSNTASFHLFASSSSGDPT